MEAEPIDLINPNPVLYERKHKTKVKNMHQCHGMMDATYGQPFTNVSISPDQSCPGFPVYPNHID
jgi:hypothetical protein